MGLTYVLVRQCLMSTSHARVAAFAHDASDHGAPTVLVSIITDLLSEQCSAA